MSNLNVEVFQELQNYPYFFLIELHIILYTTRIFVPCKKNIKSFTILYLHFVNKTTKFDNKVNEATQKIFTNCELFDYLIGQKITKS